MLFPRSLAKRIMLLAAIVLLALMRAEASVRDLQGRTGEPGRIFRVASAGSGTWDVYFFGWDARVNPSEAISRIKNALP